MTVAALFVDGSQHGVYPRLLGRERCWAGDDACLLAHGDPPYRADDARTYPGPHPVVCHPPCNLWVNMAAVNWKRYGRQRPAWYPGGSDGGCFAAALAAVRRHGGVLEHPAGSHAWEARGLAKPSGVGWRQYVCKCAPEDFGPRRMTYWVCEVWQSAYGHLARKRTWLLYCGARTPFELNWTRKPGTHQCGWFDRNKPTVGKRAASATPIKFAETLIALANWSQSNERTHP